MLSSLLLTANSYASDEIGSLGFLLNLSKAKVIKALADGTIGNELYQAGLQNDLEDAFPASNPNSPQEIYVTIIVKIGFVTAVAGRTTIIRASNQSWAEAVRGSRTVSGSGRGGRAGGTGRATKTIAPEQTTGYMVYYSGGGNVGTVTCTPECF